MTDAQRAAMGYLRDNGPSRVSEVAEGVGMGTAQTNAAS